MVNLLMFNLILITMNHLFDNPEQLAAFTMLFLIILIFVLIVIF
jgi:hypothetical protein